MLTCGRTRCLYTSNRESEYTEIAVDGFCFVVCVRLHSACRGKNGRGNGVSFFLQETSVHNCGTRDAPVREETIWAPELVGILST